MNLDTFSIFNESGHFCSCWAILVCDPAGPHEIGSGPILYYPTSRKRPLARHCDYPIHMGIDDTIQPIVQPCHVPFVTR